MSYILFNNSEKKYEGVSVSIRPTQTEGGNAVELIFPDNIKCEKNTSGFKMYSDNGELFKDFSTSKTIYMDDYGVNGYMLSDDGTFYKKPLPVIIFKANYGGTLEGNNKQSSEKYMDIEIPTPIPNENYIFVKWEPAIPKKGIIDKDMTFMAIFEYVEPIEETINRKIVELDEICTSTIESGTTVNVNGKDYHFTYHKIDDQTNIKELFDATVSTGQPVSYHADGEECRDWTTIQFAKIYLTLAGYKSNNVSYFNALKHYTMTLTDKDEIEAVQYGQELIGEYLETYNHAVETNTNLMMAILVKNGLKPEDVLGA